MIADPSDSNYSRVVDSWRPTLCVDDFDEAMRKHRSIVMSLLKHSYKAGARVPRLTPLKSGAYRIELFSPFAPLAISAVEPLEKQQQLSRFIDVTLKKSKKPLAPSDPKPDTFKEERAALYYLSFKLATQVRREFENLQILELSGRAREIWCPLLILAKLIDPTLYAAIKTFAIRKVREQAERAYYSEKAAVLAIEQLFLRGKEGNLEGTSYVEFTISEFKAEFKAVLCERWQDISQEEFERRWKSQQLGRLLSSMGIRSIRRGRTSARLRTITEEELEELRARYDVADNADNADNNIGAPIQNSPSKFSVSEPNNGKFGSQKTDRGSPLNVRNVRNVRLKAKTQEFANLTQEKLPNLKTQIIEILKKHKTLDLNQYDEQNVAKIKPLIEEMLKSGEIKEVKHNVYALGKVIKHEA